MNLQLFSAAPSLFHCCCWQLSFHCKIIKNVSSITGSSAMNKLRQSFRRKKDVYVPESSRPHQWQTDEEAVRTGKCSFAVKVTLPHTHTHTCVHPTSDTETECRADLTLMHSYLCETSSYHLPPQGHGLWLIITIQRVWAQFLSRLRDYLL